MTASRCSRTAIGEVVSSLSMLAVTMALLGGFSVLSLQSIRGGAQLVSDSSRKAQTEAGVLLRVVATQGNTTASYVWLYDYGWQSTRITSVYLDGGVLSGWSSTCNPLKAGEMCVVRLPPLVQGDLTLFFGGKSISIPL